MSSNDTVNRSGCISGGFLVGAVIFLLVLSSGPAVIAHEMPGPAAGSHVSALALGRTDSPGTDASSSEASYDLARIATAVPLSGPAYWSNITLLGAQAPDETYGGAMSFDPAQNTTVFLSYDSSPPGGSFPVAYSWEYSNYSWSLPSTGVLQQYTALAYDSSDSELIAFGGQAPIAHELGPTIPTNATYSFSDGSWVNLTASLFRLPPAADLPMMASDPAEGGALLLDPVGPNNSSQTWLFSDGNWTNLTSSAGKPPPGPSGSDSQMMYDPTLGAVIFFGGSFPGPGYALATNETWEFSAGRWTNLDIAGPDFATSSFQTMAFDNDSGALVDLVAPAYLYSANGTPSYQDWEFVHGTWVNETYGLPATPPVGYDPLSVWDGADGYLFYMSGGYDAQSWDLGSTPLSVRLSVSPTAVDVGNNVTIRVTVIGGVPPARFVYSGLPPGCPSSDVPLLNCHPTSPGNFTIGATVEDYLNESVNLSADLEVGSPLVASGPLASSAFAYVGAPVNFSVNVSGGLPPYSFAWSLYPFVNCPVIDASSFPCTLNQTGVYLLAVLVYDATPAGVTNVSGNLTVVPYPTIVSFSASPSELEVGEALHLNTSVAGGASPFTYIYANLPSGCVGTSAPNLTCAPAVAGSFSVTVNVTDGLGTVVRSSVVVTVLVPLAISEVLIAPNPTTVGTSVAFGYSVTGGAPSFRSAWAGLPPGCAAVQGNFSCVMNTGGSFDIGLTVRDSLGVVADVNETLDVRAVGATSAAPAGLGGVPLWTWGVVGGGAAVLLGVVLWDWNRRRRSSGPESVPAPPTAGDGHEIDGSELKPPPREVVVLEPDSGP